MSQYKDGTASVFNNSNIVTGSGTLWLASISAGDLFTKAGDDVAYTVAGVTNNTILTLTAPYSGSSSSGSNYGITIGFTAGGLPLLSAGDLNTAAIYNEAMKSIDNYNLSNLGTAAYREYPAPDLVGEYEIVAGVIKKDANGTDLWVYIDDANHRPIGVNRSASLNAGTYTIEIPYLKTYSKVISFVCGPDEYYASALNATIGASVGLSSAVLQFGATAVASGTASNDGVTWTNTTTSIFAINPVTTYASGNTITSHDNFRSNSFNCYPFSNNGAVIPFMPVLKTKTNDSFTLNAVDSLGTSFYTAGLSSSISFGYEASFTGGLILNGTESAVLETALLNGNIWFYGIFEV